MATASSSGVNDAELACPVLPSASTATSAVNFSNVSTSSGTTSMRACPASSAVAVTVNGLCTSSRSVLIVAVTAAPGNVSTKSVAPPGGRLLATAILGAVSGSAVSGEAGAASSALEGSHALVDTSSAKGTMDWSRAGSFTSVLAPWCPLRPERITSRARGREFVGEVPVGAGLRQFAGRCRPAVPGRAREFPELSRGLAAGHRLGPA